MKITPLIQFFSRQASYFVAVGIILLFVLFNSLAGCSSRAPLARVFSGFDVTFSRPYENSQAYRIFRRTYDEYALKNTIRMQQLKHFSDAFNRVRKEYLQEVDENHLLAAAVEGIKKLNGRRGTLQPVAVTEAALDALVGTLDPHSSYLNPDEYKDSRVVTSGEFGGLGIEINMNQDYKVIEIISPIADTPAYRAGLKAGDLITHVDGVSIKDRDIRFAVKMLRGKPNTDVRLTIQRQDNRPFDVTITRAKIQIESMKWQTVGDIGVVRITHFISNSEQALEDALKKLFRKLNYKMSGLVLDLRNNPGGLLDQSVAVADAFLSNGEIVSVRGRSGRSRGFSASNGDQTNGLPIVVLINRGSASASEIVAGALQDHGRAIVMGTRSFGKGSVQTITPLGWDGALRLTTALYYLPSGRTIQGLGVVPDIGITGASAVSSRRLEGDLPNALKIEEPLTRPKMRHNIIENNCPAAGKDGKDRVLGCAVMLLRSGSEDRFLALMNRRNMK